ncbi:hypothetical protein EJ576_00800 [Pseudomonas sp. C 49-2]|nr:hypothetical protein EJ576_00800 [Pseudomonas sp. C 49-2]
MPPIAVNQCRISWLTHCHRGQAPSHICIFIGLEVRVSGRYLPVSTAGHGCHRHGVSPPESGAG